MKFTQSSTQCIHVTNKTFTESEIIKAIIAYTDDLTDVFLHCMSLKLKYENGDCMRGKSPIGFLNTK